MPEISSKQDNKPHALLIGVADYSSFGGSDASNLKGSKNDVVLLAYYCMAVLGIPPENIRVLTTPNMTPGDFMAKVIPDELETNQTADWIHNVSQVKLGKASLGEVNDGLEWLLTASKGSEGAALFAFSGHGAWTSDEGPLLCFGDTAKDFTQGVLSLKKLGADIKSAGARNKVIALLDCCHVSASRANPTRRGKALLHAGTAEDVVGDQDLFDVSDRVLLAAHPGKEAFQVVMGGQWRGAFTFAMVTAAERWRGENGMSHGSYKQVLKRATLTLEVLDVPQKPEIWVAVRQNPFLGVKTGPTTRVPDAPSSGMQLNPDYFYTIKVDGSLLAKIVATGGTQVNVNGHALSHQYTEYWYVNPEVLNAISSSQTLTITATALPRQNDIGGEFSQTFLCGETVQFVQDLSPNSSCFMFDGQAGDPSGVKAYITLTIASNGKTVEHVQWYLANEPTAGRFNPGNSSGIAYLPTTTPPSSTYWGAASL